ncbi:hypothetical protein [Pseudomonas mangiferae]|uniref:hypothetical protein n=1 Tax=Pseudomonas mangiferae TaxID=2593654 RepID=UPI0015B62A42|nr:hypothetical protein [Pseudomonas mangiferae]
MATPHTLRLVTLGATALMGAVAWTWQARETRAPRRRLRPDTDVLVEAARTLNRSAGLLALAVAADSALEHARGDFHNRAMYTPLATSLLSLLASGHGHRDDAAAAHRLRDGCYLAAGLTGLVGSGFHLYNVSKRPGGFGWTHLFYAAPLGAPAALVLSGLLGYYGERVRDAAGDRVPRVFGLPAGQAVALMCAAGLLGTTAEAGLLHFRGAFQNPAMYLPVTAPPVSAALLAGTALAGPHRPGLRALSRLWLRFTTLLGLAGSAFHAYGITRSHGGWSNWRQNLHAGPPLPAPPSFTGLALAGLAAHALLDEERHLTPFHARLWRRRPAWRLP